VDLSPSERAINLELVQFLAATNFELKRKKAVEGHRGNQIQEVLPSSGDGKIALFLRASHFTFMNVDDPSKLCDAIVKCRRSEYADSLEVFTKRVKQTVWLHKQVAACDRFSKFISRVKEHKLGDREVSRALEKIIATGLAEYHEDDWKEFYREENTDITKVKDPLPEKPSKDQNTTHGVSHLTREQFELRTVISKLNSDVEETLHQKRSLRFFKHILSLQKDEFNCSACGISLNVAQVHVMGHCGHLLGEECCSSSDCPVSGCSGYNREYQKLSALSLIKSHSEECSEYGSKIDSIIELITWIKDVKNELTLVFAHWSESTDQLQAALTKHNIPFSDLRKEATSSKTLQHFQNQTAPKGKRVSKVLIMNIGDANASGR
jgi:hypothetical protein